MAVVGGGVTLILRYWHSRAGTFIPISVLSFSVAWGIDQDWGSCSVDPRVRGLSPWLIGSGADLEMDSSIWGNECTPGHKLYSQFDPIVALDLLGSPRSSVHPTLDLSSVLKFK